jgi:hypothetical protein
MQCSSLLWWWLHPFPGSLHAIFHICPRRQIQNSAWWLLYLELWMGGTTVSPFLGLFLGIWIICTYHSFVHGYKTVKKSHRVQPKLVQNGLWRKHSITLPTASRHLGTHLAEFLHAQNLMNIDYFLGIHITSVSAIFLADILLSSRIIQWMAPRSLELSLQLVSQNISLQCSNALF